MGIGEKIKSFIAPMDEDDVLEVEQEVEESPVLSKYEEPKSTVKRVDADTKMVLFEPRSFDEAGEVARHLKESKAAVVNLHRLQGGIAQRTIDFLTGVIVALDGEIQTIGQNVILCTPKSVNVQGKIKLDTNEK